MKVLIPIETGIGNAVLLTPMIRTLKRKYPDCRIHLLGSNRFGANELFTKDDDVEKVLETPDPEGYDILFNPFLGGDYRAALKMRLKGQVRSVIAHRPMDVRGWKTKLSLVAGSLLGFKYVSLSARHESYAYLELLCNLDVHESEFQLQPSFSKRVIEIGIRGASEFKLPANYIVVQVGASNQKPTPKKWPASHWAEVVRLLAREYQVVLVGDRTETEITGQIAQKVSGTIDLAGKTSVSELIGVIHDARGVIGVDSGISHIAAALNRPGLVIWGPTTFNRTHPIGIKTRFISLDLACAPCTGSGLPGLLREHEAAERCPIEMRCMREIRPEVVVDRFRNLLKEET